MSGAGIAAFVGGIVLGLAALVGWLAFEDARWDEHRWGLAKVRPVPPADEFHGERNSGGDL